MICTAHGSWVGPALHTNPAQSHTTAGEELLDDISVDDISVDDLSVDDLSEHDLSLDDLSVGDLSVRGT